NRLLHVHCVPLGRVWSYPNPNQKPHPPILLGGPSDHTLKRVVEFCDGWFPIASRGGFNPKDAVRRLRQVASTAGRDFSTLSISVFGAPADKAALAEYREAGIQRAVLG